MNLGNIIDYIVKIATIASVIFVAYQAYMFKKDYVLKNDKAERENAIKLSKFYCEEILSRIFYLDYIFKETGVEKILADLSYNDLKDFNQSEMKKLIKDKDLNEIKQKINNIDIFILIEASQLLKPMELSEYNNSIVASYIEKIIQNQSGDEIAIGLESKNGNKKTSLKNFKSKNIFEYYEMKYRTELNITLYDTMNLLEYFCMNFKNGIADEETVYQSLHQTFLSCIKLLYIWIAEINISGKDKYYTNIIWLFNKWSDRYNEKCRIETELQNETIHNKRSLKK